MGRPSFIKPRKPTGTSRGGFFQRSGSAAVALFQQAASGPLCQHGVASGDPLTDRVIL